MKPLPSFKTQLTNIKSVLFETVVECTFDELPVLLENIHNACAQAGTEKMITNIKIQVNFENGVTIKDKMEKYE